MNFRRTLWAMLVKEVRAMMRERGQVIGMVIGIAGMTFGISMPLWQISKEIEKDHMPRVLREFRTESSPQTDSINQKNTEKEGEKKYVRPPDHLVAAGIRWAVIGIAGPLSLFIAVTFGAALSLAAFVGEKEAATIEVLLTTPLSDRMLYAIKCMAVMLPTALITYAIMGAYAAAALAWVGPILPQPVVKELIGGLLWASPLPIFMIAAITGMMLSVSVRAETTKGAGQLVGIVFVGIIFSFWIIPLLVLPALPDSLRVSILAAGAAWLALPFGIQYMTVIGALAVFSILLLSIGYALLNREKLVT